jgi:hypothetical protein
MSTYQIQGTVSLKYDSSLSVLLTPAAGYVSPDKKYAVFFPITSCTDKSKALIKEIIDEKVVGLEIPINKHIEAVLIAASGSQKAILLLVDENKKISGFTYPAQ